MTARLPTVAIIGPDGAGKTTVARRLVEVLPIPVRYMYMGWNYDASNLLLPTNRMLRGRRNRHPDAADVAKAPRRHRSRVLAPLSAAFKLANLIAEGWFRQIIANRWSRAGYLVIFDRHFVADYPDPRGRDRGSSRRRLRHAILRRALPAPSILIYLDAPPETLLDRKGEGTLESLQRQRTAYRHVIANHPRAAEIPSDGSVAEVTAAVSATIMKFIDGRGARG